MCKCHCLKFLLGALYRLHRDCGGRQVAASQLTTCSHPRQRSGGRLVGSWLADSSVSQVFSPSGSGESAGEWRLLAELRLFPKLRFVTAGTVRLL